MNDLECTVEKFESAFRADPKVDVRRFFPEIHHPNFSEVVTELLRVDMEMRWGEPERQTLTDYQRQFPQILCLPSCFDRIAYDEYRLRTMSGETITPFDYQCRYAINVSHWPVVFGQNKATRFLQRTETTTGGVDTDSGIDTNPDLAVRLNSIPIVVNQTVESTLRSRLRFVALAMLVLLSYLSALTWLNPAAKVGLFLGSTWLVWLNGLCVAICLAISVVVWLRDQITMPWLRLLELILFGSVLIELSSGLFSDLFLDHELTRPIEEGDHELFHYASSWSLPYFALIVSYGVLIPSTWKRCMVIVAVMAFIPLGICAVAAVWFHGWSISFLQSFLLQMTFWMVSAVALAVYGVRRLEESQRHFSKSGRLGKYRLIRRIDHGGMGEILQAEDTMLERRCAVKLMHPRWALQPKLLTRFQREVKVLAGISHPNIVQVYDFGFTNEGVFYYVMEYLDGVNLEQKIAANGPLSQSKVVEIMIHVAEALDSIHRGGIFHRDVKPSNIFLHKTANGEVTKLLDFGLIKSIVDDQTDNQITHDDAIVGTPAYMSPEQAVGSLVDHRSDFYSLGAVAWFALTGKQFFARPTAIETLNAQLKESPLGFETNMEGIDPRVQAILIRCLSKDLRCRFETATELLSELRAVQSANTADQ